MCADWRFRLRRDKQANEHDGGPSPAATEYRFSALKHQRVVRILKASDEPH
jgi:hypothetical protein